MMQITTGVIASRRRRSIDAVDRAAVAGTQSGRANRNTCEIVLAFIIGSWVLPGLPDKGTLSCLPYSSADCGSFISGNNLGGTAAERCHCLCFGLLLT
jgi:hypothetical protein